MDNTVHWLEPVALPATSPEQHIQLGTGVIAIHTPLHESLTALKNEIDGVTEIGYWDDAKKITNPFEYIFLSLQRRMHRSVAGIIPLSRSYFKMIELWDLLGMDELLTRGQPFGSTHGAEGPGGFLEAVQHRTGRHTRMLAMTLRSTERAVPGWRKSAAFLTEYPDIHVTYGADGTGNLYSLANQAAFAAQAAAWLAATATATASASATATASATASATGRKALLYTADGGFDFSSDYNGQENTVHRLLAAEALAGLQTLAPGGTMILKVFDTKHIATLELLWMVGGCFERTAIVKPHTSRPANSERYWVGSGLLPTVPKWVIVTLNTLTRTDAPHGWNHIFAVSPWTAKWVAQVQAFQEEVEHHQFANIELTLGLIRTPQKTQIQDLLYRNIQSSREWCVRHRVPENRQYVGLTLEQLVSLNLEEALAPFPAVAARMSSPAPSRLPPMHRALSSAPLPRPPTELAWRSALPLSIRRHSPSQTVGDTPSPSEPAPLESHEVPGPVPGTP
jgi:hypothetical protein